MKNIKTKKNNKKKYKFKTRKNKIYKIGGSTLPQKPYDLISDSIKKGEEYLQQLVIFSSNLYSKKCNSLRLDDKPTNKEELQSIMNLYNKLIIQ